MPRRRILKKEEECFKKHSFKELNNIDIEIFKKILVKYQKYFDKEKLSIFDVGCNAGSFIKSINHLNTEIHTFEPHPILSKKVKENYPNIIMNSYCLGNQEGEIIINLPQYSLGISSIIDRPVFKELGQKIEKYKTKITKLDTYCRENKINFIDFIKIDVEGYEKNVLDGAAKMLENNKIKMGIFEIGQTLIDAGTSSQEIEELLINYGYKIDKNISINDYVFFLP